MTDTPRIREIPYNYTSFSDREIMRRYLGDEGWTLNESLRNQRRTSRSARMLFEILGDMWVIERNPFIQEDLLNNQQRRKALIDALHHRLAQFEERINQNDKATRLHELAKTAVQTFESTLISQKKLRETIKRTLSKFTHADNICVDGLSRVSHSTDATDWRVEHPIAVLVPDSEEELPDLLAACMKLNLPIIPRGGGTGYTGSAVPLHNNAVVINTEKLDFIDKIDYRQLAGLEEKVPTIRVGAGAITQQVSNAATANQLIFAVDPTSQEASTIGGNIAMNAGGKKAVLWGTTLDNLASWTMIVPYNQGVAWIDIERLNHNLGKIHDQETVQFRISTFSADHQTKLKEPEILSMSGSAFRKKGLGKDVTDKVLFGLSGVQKEGCDGLITSATFVLHPKPRCLYTVCLEFFGSVREAVPAIVETIAYFKDKRNVRLAGLEHLDERYIKAVNYSTKSTRLELPKMLLLADVAGDSEEAVEQAAQQMIKHAQIRQGEGFIARTSEMQHRFWSERKRTAAIAAHTNAFKVNEDVVIPPEKLGDYSDEVERMNIEQSINNKLKIINVMRDFLTSEIPELKNNDQEEQKLLDYKRERSLQLLQDVKEDWQTILADSKEKKEIFQRLQSRELRISYRQSIAFPLNEIFSGREFENTRKELENIHKKLRASRLFIALHMHAGDGNVHTNIPVNSHDYEMLHEAEHLVEEIMKLAISLGGVITGEHGIGLTKLNFLERSKKEAFVDYKNKVDPQHFFNRGKLLEGADLSRAYTPSLSLVQQEALILEATDLGELNKMVKHCLRCGKCKPHCTTHIPRANLLYSPRNKILASGLIVEAVLYEEQTRRGISAQHFEQLNDLADHCTVCHRCFKPCPVDIDFGDVTVKMREILKRMKKRHFNIGAWAGMQFLNVTNKTTVEWMRKVFIQMGYYNQRLAHQISNKIGLLKTVTPRNTTGKTPIHEQVVHFLRKPLPNQLPKQPLRHLLQLNDSTKIPIIRDRNKTTEQSEAVFYFVGCGSERLFSEIGLATLAMLYEVGVQTVLPPSYLCCGYPQNASGDTEKGKSISTSNRVLFHRVANTLNYLDIKTVLVSCGTCMDQLLKYEFQQIFPDCRLLDIHEYLLEKGIKIEKPLETEYLYHDPCHSPIKKYPPLQVASDLIGKKVTLSDRCCGEAGTFATARPDIATQVRFRKQQEIEKGVLALGGKDKQIKMLTSCPACKQGLIRYEEETGISVDYIVVELAKATFGEHWQETATKNLSQNIDQVLL
jgi:FAD/FMN-containing dehydrogenase/Fe-S oxidoreductase